VTTNPLTAALATEHRRDLLREADDYRRASTARRGRRPASVTRLGLRIRQVHPEDAPLLADVFVRLSPASRLARFLHPKRTLTPAELRYFTVLDHRDHEALLAVTRVRGEAVGVARFIRDRDDPTAADVAVAVVDEWQGRGVGTMLATRLAARALHEDIAHFSALMSASNERARRLLGRFGDVSVVARDGATVTYRVSLPGPVLVAPRRGIATCAPAGRA
jgi:RimJ/RimL family protein N-acetyltransferase